MLLNHTAGWKHHFPKQCAKYLPFKPVCISSNGVGVSIIFRVHERYISHQHFGQGGFAFTL
jgi:hypothetical protein